MALRRVASVHCVHYIGEKDCKCKARFATGGICIMQRVPIENLISSHTGGTVKCTCERAPLYVVNFLYGGGGGGALKK